MCAGVGGGGGAGGGVGLSLADSGGPGFPVAGSVPDRRAGRGRVAEPVVGGRGRLWEESGVHPRLAKTEEVGSLKGRTTIPGPEGRVKDIYRGNIEPSLVPVLVTVRPRQD